MNLSNEAESALQNLTAMYATLAIAEEEQMNKQIIAQFRASFNEKLAEFKLKGMADELIIEAIQERLT